MKISVAILTWNRARLLALALESVAAQTRQPDEIVVVDSNSTDGTAALTQARFPAVRYIRLYRNLGCPEGRNLAMANCTGDIIYSLDDDGQLHPQCLEITEQVFGAHPKAGIVASKTFPKLNPTAEEVQQQLAKQPRRTVRFSGGASAIHREVLATAGYYPHDFWRQSEETDLAVRAIDRGFEIWYAPAAIMLHPSGISDSGAALNYTTFNTLQSIVRLCPAPHLPVVLLHQTGKLLKSGVEKNRVGLVLRGIGNWVIAIPRLLRQRRPITAASMREFLDLRGEYYLYQTQTRPSSQLDKRNQPLS